MDTLRDSFDGDTFTVGEMIEAIEERGFGPLLLIPALFVLMPTGAIPGVPTTMALVNAVIAGQLVLGKRHPWLPQRLRRVPIKREKFERACASVQGITRRIDRLIYPRLVRLTASPAPRLIAGLSIVIGLFMIPLELVPFAAALPAAAIAFLALGLSVRDGLLVAIGVTVGVVGLGIIGVAELG